MIEIELTGIEETKWATDKKRLKGEHAFYSEKAVIFIFPPDFQERAGPKLIRCLNTHGTHHGSDAAYASYE